MGSRSMVLLPLYLAPAPTYAKNSSYFFNTTKSLIRRKRRKPKAISARLDNSQEPKQQQQQQLNLSVLRFTLGIPGLDESYLPRWIGFAFGSLILLNHFVGSGPATPSQLRSEVLGICLAAFSISLPFLGKFLKLISVQDALCVRGYWNTPEDASKAHILDWIMRQIQQFGFSDLKDALYFPQISDSQVWEMLPKGVLSLLVQPVLGAPNPGALETDKIDGFILLASSASYAYGDTDRAWIKAVANKFKGYAFSIRK